MGKNQNNWEMNGLVLSRINQLVAVANLDPTPPLAFPCHSSKPHHELPKQELVSCDPVT